MSTHFKFNFDYNKQALLDIFDNLEKNLSPTGKRLRAVLPAGISNYEILQPFFEQFPFVQKHDDSLDFSETISNTLPQVLAGATGIIVFPLNGIISLKTYQFKFSDPRSTWSYAIKTTDVLTTTMINDIESTLIETVLIDGPIAVNGQSTHSYQIDGTSKILALKIPLSVSWDDVVTALTV